MITRKVVVAFSLLTLLIPLTAASAQSGPENAAVDAPLLQAYSVQTTAEQADELRQDQYDISAVRASDANTVTLEVIMTATEAQRLSARGLQVTANAASAQALTTGGVFRPYLGPDGLKAEMEALAAQFPGISKLHTIGQSGLGTDILALQVTKKAQDRSVPGSRPTALYVSAQHAREWISPEVNRRLLNHVLRNYNTDAEIKNLVNTTELWFVLVANPDGYDYTFSDERLWRKTLRDNDGDGVITGFDGVDPNRNFPTFWGYDNEGSDPNPAGQTYRGPFPASENETVAYDNLVSMITPEFLVNYHSAAELILYGIGYQVATPSPDDILLATLAGDDANPAIPGFDPDLSAELYTTNGETTEHMAAQYGVLAYTPELSTCQTVADDPRTCGSVFHFPDDEAKIQAEFEKNLPFALDVAKSAANPFEPVSHIGNVAPDFQVDVVTESYGTTQTLAAEISRQVTNTQLRYRINGGPAKRIKATEWAGGESYGGNFNDYYREVRGSIRGLNVGDTVEYWFRGSIGSGGTQSQHYFFEVTGSPADVLILQNEDYDGFRPTQTLPGPVYGDFYTDALDANGISWAKWDMDAQGSPHDLGILSHFDAIVWYVGDNIVTRDEEDNQDPFDLGVADQMQTTTLAVRDYLNEGGKLMKTGDRAGFFGINAGFAGGLFYGENGDPDTACQNVLAGTCLIFSDDFHQYWLGDFANIQFGDPGGFVGTDIILDTIDLNGGTGANNSFDASQSVVTSSVLPEAEFPQFASRSIGDYLNAGTDPFGPKDGDWYVGVLATNNQYNRFGRTIDLTGATNASLAFDTSYDVEGAYDFFVVEAHTVGQDDWTTLPDINGNTVQGPLAACTDGLWDDVHNFIFDHYVDFASCAPTGPTGEFHAFNSGSGGYIPVEFDLSAFAGEQVEVVLSYISDVGVTNTGVFVDNVVVDVDGAQEVQGWETDQDPWAAQPPPAGSPGNLTDWVRSTGLVDQVIAAGVATDDTVYLPWGFEAITTDLERVYVMDRIMDYLIG